jgi:hypothetical protein
MLGSFRSQEKDAVGYKLSTSPLPSNPVSIHRATLGTNNPGISVHNRDQTENGQESPGYEHFKICQNRQRLDSR